MTLFPDYKEPEPTIPPGLPERMRVMLRMYGLCPGHTCGACVHLVRHCHAGKTAYLKCDLTIVTCGAGTDWRSRWPACGKFKSKGEVI